MKIELEEYNKLKELAFEILDANAGCLLSGSIGLKELGYKPRREPSDIDIFLPYGQKFMPLSSMVRHHYETDIDYENIYYKRSAFKIGEIKIDVFTPEDIEGNVLLADENCEQILAAHLIIGFKVQHSLGESYNRYKHRDDVIHLLVNV